MRFASNRPSWACLLALAVFASLLCPSGAAAASFDETIPFVFDEWIDVGLVDGGVEIHRFRLSPSEGGITKSRLFRPGKNSRYSQTVVVQLEYTNGTSRDWKVEILAEWIDENGDVIDGYRSNEGLDDETTRGIQDSSVSTLSYGIDRAKTLRLELPLRPD